MASTNFIHEGYIDGLQGKSPNPELETSEEYRDGWLHGSKDRDDGMTADALLVPVTVGVGDTVTVPKGTSIRTVYHGSRAAGRKYKIRIYRVTKSGGTSRYTAGASGSATITAGGSTTVRRASTQTFLRRCPRFSCRSLWFRLSGAARAR